MSVLAAEEWLCETGLADDFFRVTARAVTGADGQYLVDDIDLSSHAAVPIKTEEKKVDHGPQLKPFPRLRPDTYLISKIRNRYTGQVYDWNPIFTLDDHLEVIEVYVTPSR